MMYYNELYHYGVKGMKWGVRRFQNKDGTLTPKGKKRYSGNRGDIEKQYDPKNRDDMNALRKEISTYLRDLGFNDTKAGREFIINNDLIKIYPDYDY